VGVLEIDNRRRGGVFAIKNEKKGKMCEWGDYTAFLVFLSPFP
jgi:hypothetical protein